jgi:hypothetical protein
VDSLYYRFEVAALFGKTILNADGDLGIDNALNNALGLQLAQAITENTI